MAGRVNRRGWIVIESIAATDQQLCVDFFKDPAGGYGFAQFRTDAEDTWSWTVIGDSATRRFVSIGGAVDAAVSAVPWLEEERRPREALQNWRESLAVDP